MIVKTMIRKGDYYDSVKLMIATRNVSELEGIDEAAIVMGTELNKEILRRVNLITEELENALPDDLIISIRASNKNALDNALSKIDELLNQRNEYDEDSDYRPKSLDSAIKIMPDMNFCIVSVPGRYAKNEAMKALKNGMHVLLFSDNVTVDEEIELKKYANENNLFLMGPDCGTAMINNVPLGFCNKVRKGNIGIVAAAGTGLQEVMTLIHKEGSGISQAIGTGGRDLSKEVGGLTMLQGLKALNQDSNTKVIVLISKPPAPEIAEKILGYVKDYVSKPVIVNFIGSTVSEVSSAIIPAKTLEEAALKAVSLSEEKNNLNLTRLTDEELEQIVQREAVLLNEDQKYVRGLYSGGTLNYESMLILSDYIGGIYSNKPLEPKMKLEDAYSPINHSCIDLGEDEFTVGRPHPMIDTSLREEYLEKEIIKKDVGVILLDIVIGYGTHSNPGQVFANKIKKCKSMLAEEGRHVSIIAYVCGTDEDPQDLSQQEKLLRDAGAIVITSNAAAAKLTGMIAAKKQ